MNQLNAYMALEIMHDRIERAERERRARPAPQEPAAGRARRRPHARPLRRVLAALRRAPAPRATSASVTLICRPEAEESVAPAARGGYS